MKIEFINARAGPVFSITRDDGTQTRSRPDHAEYFIRHDLLHYAVESILGLRDSFYGLLERGWTVADFLERGAARRLPPEAIETEYIVNQLQLDLAFAEEGGAEALNAAVAAAAAQNSGGTLRPHVLTDDELARIRLRHAELVARWAALGVGERLVLTYP